MIDEEKSHFCRRWQLLIRIGLSLLFWFSWILFGFGFYVLLTDVRGRQEDVGWIVFGVLGLFGAINVMMVAIYFLIVNLWVAKTRD
ncbi:MAG TPA: hypothetical protein VL754_05365 [Verrucomicrobiae bacterium]|nr:hypothetical protein [Verrucomicrobiae bacterium]